MKSKLVTFLLCTFLGNLGVHRFYLGKIGSGILYLFTLGFCGIGTFIDLIRIAGNSLKDKDSCDLNDDIPAFIPWIVVGIHIFIFFIGFLSGIFSVSEDVVTEPKNVVEEHIEDKKVEVEKSIEVETESLGEIEESKTTTVEPVKESVTTEELEKILQELEEYNNNNTENVKEEKKVSTSQPSYQKVTVKQLTDTLDENALRAEKTYQDMYVEITGYLSNVDSDGEYFSITGTNDSWDFNWISCDITDEKQLDKIINLNNGDQITVYGKITTIGEVIGYRVDVIEIK